MEDPCLQPIKGLGCIACSAVAPASSWSKQNSALATYSWVPDADTRLHRLRRHAQAIVHKEAVLHLLATQPTTAPGRHCVGSPDATLFSEVLGNLLNGRAPDGPPSAKTRAVIWCLEEALLESQRAALRNCGAVTLARDERAQRLLVRYAACGTSLQLERGMLGLAKGFGTGAEAITEATEGLLRRVCTQKHGCPNRNIQPVLDEDLPQHIKNRIEVLVVDAAADELLSGDIGRGRRTAAAELTDAQLTPNLLLVARDRAHASRRRGASVELLTGQPWVSLTFGLDRFASDMPAPLSGSSSARSTLTATCRK